MRRVIDTVFFMIAAPLVLIYLVITGQKPGG